jgi:hypothetical protein
VTQLLLSITTLLPHYLTHTLSYSHIHLLTHSLTHTFTYSHIHLLTHSLTHIFTYAHIHLLANSLTPSLPLLHSLPHSLITYLLPHYPYLTHSLTHQVTRHGALRRASPLLFSLSCAKKLLRKTLTLFYARILTRLGEIFFVFIYSLTHSCGRVSEGVRVWFIDGNVFGRLFREDTSKHWCVCV